MRSSTKANKNLLLVLGTFAAIALVSLSPAIFKISAAQKDDKRSRPQRSGFSDYDIRKDKNSTERIVEFRNRNGKNAAEIADIRESFARGAGLLKSKLRNLKVEYNDDLKLPEMIGTDVIQGRSFLTPASQEGRAGILRRFIRDNEELTGVRSDRDADQLKIAADYSNPENGLSMVEFAQKVNGIPVFRGSIKAGFTNDNRIIRVINNFAPGLDDSNVSTEFGDPKNAFAAAASSIDHRIDPNETTVNVANATPNKLSFGEGDFAPTAEKVYFPTEPGVAVPAWQILIWEPVDAYYMIVDGQTGTLLWRKNITDPQTQSATYNVYSNPNAMVDVARNPFALTPGQTSPNGVQGGPITRTLVARIGNESPYTFNNLGWITDGSNTTDGNNVEAGLDRENPNPGNNVGIDPNGKPTGSPNRVFDFPISPGIPSNPILNTGDAPLPAGQTPGTCQAQGTAAAPTDFQRAVVTQLFYIANWFHDETYLLGFNEAAGNFQNSNFGRGGAEGDRISAEAQDCSSTNNAGFASPPDGIRGRMQMYIWTAPSPDYDGSLDADVVIHELTHGLSNRLHGNSTGLSGQNMSRAMGEGWSDFYAHALLSEPADPIDGVYPLVSYATYRGNPAPGLNNYYYGIRRFPKAVMALTGPNGKPHNPLTFNDIDETKDDLSDGAFSPAFTTTADGVHAAGEVWSSALWEIRAKYIARLGWANGNRRILQHVTDGMKLAPLNPTFLQERDAILAGALANGSPEDVADIWAGFAIRGMGASASIQDVGGSDTFGSGTGQTRVTEAFDLPNLQQFPNITVSDSTGDNDGIFEPGEPVRVTVSLRNLTGIQATNVTAQIAGGGAVFYGTIAHNGTASHQINYTIPINAPCGAIVTITINVTSSLGPVSFQRVIQVGSPIVTYTENFDGVSAPSIPSAWTATSVLGGLNFGTTTTNTNSAPNAAFAANSATIAGGADLTMPVTPITAQAAILSFRNRYDTEAGWDGGVLEISIGGGPFTDIITAGGSFIENGYNGFLSAATPTGTYTPNPLNGRDGWSGSSGGYVTTSVRLPAAAAGQNVQFRFRFGNDDNTAGIGPNSGWNIDNVQVFGQASCSFTPTVIKSRADFDGDGKSDLSVVRPSNNGWYINKSNGGIEIIQWGLSGDRIVPGRYDGDSRADFAVFRPSENRWYILGSNGHTVTTHNWGLAGDKPVPGDYDGDGKNDPAIFRPSENKWYVRSSGGGGQVLQWGLTGDIPVPADYNADGKTDFAVYRNGQWHVAFSSGGVISASWGLAGDRPVPADYDGDNKDDFALWRPSDGKWYIRRSTNGGTDVYGWGLTGDIPAPGDYDGDGRDDPAVYRNGTWYLLRSSAGIAILKWGLSGDLPVPAGYIPSN